MDVCSNILLVVNAICTVLAAVVCVVAIGAPNWRHIEVTRNEQPVKNAHEGLWKTCSEELSDKGCTTLDTDNIGTWLNVVRGTIIVAFGGFVIAGVVLLLRFLHEKIPIDKKITGISQAVIVIISGILAIVAGAVYSANVDYDENSYRGSGVNFSSTYSADTLYCVQLDFLAGILALVAFIVGLVHLRRTTRDDNGPQRFQ